MIKYIPVEYVGRIIKLNDTSNVATTLKSTSELIDYSYIADEAGVLTYNDKETPVKKGDLILCLYGSIVDEKYSSDGRTYIVIGTDSTDGIAEWLHHIEMRANYDLKRNESKVMSVSGCSDEISCFN